VWQGAMDATLTPDRAQCGFDRMKKDLMGAPSRLPICGDPAGTHGGVVRNDMPYMLDWLGARLMGTAEPAACTPPPMNTCPSLPPNID